MKKITVIFVHGYSVTNVNTYGEMPLRLRAAGLQNGVEIQVEEIFLGKYISFNDAVSLQDISRAFNTALGDKLPKDKRFVCITHSTGGPVIRDWWNRYYNDSKPPLSHLIMLAPANFGSALAKLGKSKLSRIKTWWEGVEPGQKVLDWLELGSSQAWKLNKKWIDSDGSQIGAEGVFPFVITGQSIDRKFYDSLNSYTGELGSDGVVRSATTNLNSRYLRLLQKTTTSPDGKITVSSQLVIDDEIKLKVSPAVPFRIVKGKSHSNEEMGILRSVKKELSDTKSNETINAILQCIGVENNNDYDKLIAQFETETAEVQKQELIEEEKKLFLSDRHFIHDRYSQVIFRVTDSEGFPVTDFDLIFTGPDNDPNHLPQGFAMDRQQNGNNPETITYYFNYDIMVGTAANKYRPVQEGISALGLVVKPRPDTGFVRYQPCSIVASEKLLTQALQPNSTTLVEIVLHRMVSSAVFVLDELSGDTMPTKSAGEFAKTKEGKDIVK